MGGIRAIIQIFLQAPGAIVRGHFQVDHESRVTGLPARIVGVLLLYLALFWVVDVVVFFSRGRQALPDEYLLFRGLTVLGSIVTSAVICAVCRKRPRRRSEEDAENEEEDEGAEVEKRPGRQRSWSDRDGRDW